MDQRGFFDLQVNGYAGVDFNQDDLSAADLHRACRLLREHGVRGILATIGTEEIGRMQRRLANLVALRELDPLARELIAGIHIEGPFINPVKGFIGAHAADAVRPAEVELMKPLLDAGAGLVRLVTLAPEWDAGFAVTRYLVGQGVAVAAGHCDPPLDTLRGAIDAGLTLFTHLGNGCPAQLERHDNIVQRVLSLRDQLWICFIADGVHVPVFALRNYLKAAGIERSIVVTDCIAPAGMGPGRYTNSRWQLDIGPDMVARAPDGTHLLGSAITMPQTWTNLTSHLGLSSSDAALLTLHNPLSALGLPAFPKQPG